MRLNVASFAKRCSLFFVLSMSMFLPACGGAGASLLEKGKTVDTGKRRFDRYFEDVAQIREKIGAFDPELFKVRERLIEELDVSVDASLPVLMAAVRKRAIKLRDFGLSISLRLTPNAKVFKQEGELTADDRDETLVTMIEQSASGALSTYQYYGELLELLGRLDEQRVTLADRITELSPSEPKRDVIEREIVAAGRVLAKLKRRMTRDRRTLALFLLALSEAADTGAIAARDTQCEEALSKYKPRRRRRSRWKGRRVRPRAPVKPKPKGEDFEM